MKEIILRLKPFLMMMLLVILPITQLIFFIFSTTINTIGLYYLSFFIVFFPLLFISKSQLNMTLKNKLSELLIICFSIVSFLTLILLSINFLFAKDEIRHVNFKLISKGTRMIKSTSSYRYIRLSRNNDTCDFYVIKNEFDQFIIGDMISVDIKKGFLGLLIVDNIDNERD